MLDCGMNDDLIFSSPVSEADRFRKAIARFDAENAQDPNTETVDGAECSRELIYAKRLTSWVLKLCPEASEELRLASRCQHLCRWMIPRQTHEMTRAGYLRWRNELKSFHARKAAEILCEVGYPENVIERVRELNLKKNFPQDHESRVLEDALCLVFLEFQFADLASKTAEDKMVSVLQKSWKKMTPKAHGHALKLAFSQSEKRLLERAIAEA